MAKHRIDCSKAIDNGPSIYAQPGQEILAQKPPAYECRLQSANVPLLAAHLNFVPGFSGLGKTWKRAKERVNAIHR